MYLVETLFCQKWRPLRAVKRNEKFKGATLKPKYGINIKDCILKMDVATRSIKGHQGAAKRRKLL